MRIRLIGSRSRIARKLLRFYHWNTRLGCVLTKATCVQFPCRFAARLTLCSDTCQPEVSSFPLVNVAALTPPNLPTKLGNITGRNIISCASLRNVFHWLSSLFKWYKSVLLKRKRDTRTEKTNKERYHLKWCQSFFVFFECISCSPSWKQCTTWMIICLMTSCKGPIAHL